MCENGQKLKPFYWLKPHSLGEKRSCDNCKHRNENEELCGKNGWICGSWEEAEEEQLKLF